MSLTVGSVAKRVVQQFSHINMGMIFFCLGMFKLTISVSWLPVVSLPHTDKRSDSNQSLIACGADFVHQEISYSGTCKAIHGHQELPIIPGSVHVLLPLCLYHGNSRASSSHIAA